MRTDFSAEADGDDATWRKRTVIVDVAVDDSREIFLRNVYACPWLNFPAVSEATEAAADRK